MVFEAETMSNKSIFYDAMGGTIVVWGGIAIFSDEDTVFSPNGDI